MTVQQRLTTPERLSTALQMHPRCRRRRVIARFIRDIGVGSQSIDELAFVAHLRRSRLPLPDRQVVRQGPDGRWYLDARWNADGRVAEIDGAHHQGGANPITDALRQNAVAVDGDRVLRVPDIGLRSDPDAFLDQIEAALNQRRGCLIVVRPFSGPDSSTLASAGSSLDMRGRPRPARVKPSSLRCGDSTRAVLDEDDAAVLPTLA